MQKNNITFLIRRIIYAALIMVIGYAISLMLSSFNYPKDIIFYVIVGIVLIGTLLNTINHFTTRFFEEEDALIIKKGIRQKSYAISYSVIIKCTVQQGFVNKLFNTKQITITYPDYKGIHNTECLGLSAEYADMLLTHITQKSKGKDVSKIDA